MYYSEIIASFFALVYIYSAAREQYISWWWSVVSSVFWAYASYVHFQLYVDFWLQIFYIGIAFVGMYHWKKASRTEDTRKISSMSLREHITVIVPGVALSVVFGYLFETYTVAAATYIDSLTTVFSILNTFLLVRKKIENWIYWIVIDSVMAYLFFSRGGYFFGTLYVIYLFMSVDGYIRWKSAMRNKEISHI